VTSRSRIWVIVAATIAVLLVGAAVGMLLTLARVGSDAPPGADSVDVGFAQDMRVHHLQAVTMAGIERDATTNIDLLGLAFDIESTQLAQASEMSGWLTSWGQPNLPAPGEEYMTWMAGPSGHGHTSQPAASPSIMPGMASPEELDQLRKATGEAKDVLFLQLMLRHHQGGREMAEYAAEHASVGYVRNLAQKIVESQGQESTLMEGALADRGAEPLPAP
jgi:uncharacterized protein (DUF305 family)